MYTSIFTNKIWFSKNTLIPGTYFKNMVKTICTYRYSPLGIEAYRLLTTYIGIMEDFTVNGDFFLYTK
jgi:hypothetical protein